MPLALRWAFSPPRVPIPLYRSVVDGHFEHAVGLPFEQVVGLVDAAQGKTVGDEGSRVYAALGDELQHFFAVATVDASRLESQVLAYMSGRGNVCGSS